MKKVFDQTVRDIKREVNKKVLKVPGIEQKVLDATSNEPWGPHGTLLADIALASRNFHEYQLIMTVIWKRINDTGKNWRHVYKGLTVLDYLVANGSERVIDDIKEHAYQISTLSSFHYIDSSGRDQGNNVRKKSQSLVDLVNDKERIIEVRQKAAANREKFRSSPGGMHRPSSYGNFDDGYRDDDRNGRDRDYNYRNDRYGDRDRHSTEYEDRYSYKDEDYRGRSRSVGDYSVRSRSSDHDNKDDDTQFSSRGLERKYSEQNIGAPPSYEDAIGASPTERNSELPTSGSSSPAIIRSSSVATSVSAHPDAPVVEDVEAFDEFDPRGPVSGGAAVGSSPPPPVVNSPEMDLLGSLSDSFLAIVPVQPISSSSEPQTVSESPFGAPLSGEDLFGDSPFKAVPVSESNMPSSTHHANAEPAAPFAEPFLQEANSAASGNNDIDILAGILPSTVSPQILPTSFSNPPNVYPDAFSNPQSLETLQPQSFMPQNYMPQPHASQHFMPQPPNSHVPEIPPQLPEMPPHQFMPPSLETPPQPPHTHVVPEPQAQNYMSLAQNYVPQAQNYVPQAQNYVPQTSLATNMYTHTSNGNSSQQSGMPLALVPQPTKDKFETKSTVWSDTLSRGLVNLNISGPKTNPLADIGVDFDSINRKEKRFEKQPAAPVTSNVTMGKAMGAGSGIGRAGASAIRPQQPTSNPYGAQMRPQQPPNNPYGAPMQPMYPQNNPYGPQTRPPYGYPPNSQYTAPNPYAGYR